MNNKLIVWRVINQGMRARRTGVCSTPLSEVEVVENLNSWEGLPFVLDNLFWTTDSPSGVRDMFFTQQFKGIEDDLAIDRTLGRHLSHDETNDHAEYRKKIQAEAKLLKLKLIEEMFKMGGKESCTINIFQYTTSLQRVRPIRDGNGKILNPNDYTTVDGMDYVNWAFLISAPYCTATPLPNK